MAIELLVERRGYRLAPMSAADEESMDGLASGVTYRAVITRAKGRSVQHHRLLFALIGMARENFDGELSIAAVLDVLKLKTGHVRITQLPSGELIMAPASISFESMDQDPFNAWFPRAVDVIAREFLNGADPLAVTREAHARVAGRIAA